MRKKVPAGPARGKGSRTSPPSDARETGFSPLGSGLEPMPRWRSGADPKTVPEMLLVALAGDKGEYSAHDPIEAAAFKLSVELRALADALDDAPIATVLRQHADRARALAELIGVTRVGSAA